jgi:hypothetical protein
MDILKLKWVNVNDVVIIYASAHHITVKGVRFKPNIVHGCNVKSSWSKYYC